MSLVAEKPKLDARVLADALVEGKVLVAGRDAAVAADELVRSPDSLFHGLKVHVNVKLDPDYWELY